MLKQMMVHLPAVGKQAGRSHKERLEAFYGEQAEDYDSYRQRFLWGRPGMLQRCSELLKNSRDIVWIDLGGGTGSNVEVMLRLLPASRFSRVFVVDLD
jgi:betaine lipid synthase